MSFKLRHFIEDIFIILLLILNLLEFMDLLPGDIDYIKKIISWTLIGYLFYRFDVPKILFGTSSNDINTLIIISYILLAFKKFTASIFTLIKDSFFFRNFFDMVIANRGFLDEFTFIMGGTALLVLSIFMSMKFSISKKSLMGLINESGTSPKRVSSIIIRAFVIFLVLSTFFIILFDYVIEWLAIAVDAPTFMLLLAFYLFYIIRVHNRYNVENLLHRIGSFGEDFYKRFISLFQNRKKVLLAVSGLLVLHLLVDLGIFILPYITRFKSIYFRFLNPLTHQNIYSLFLADINDASMTQAFTILITYMLNIVGIMMMMLLPAYIWYGALKERKLSIPLIPLFLSAMTALIISPIFRFSTIKELMLVGVDIQTNSPAAPVLAAIIAFIVFSMALYMKRKGLTRVNTIIALGIADITIVSYAYSYLISSAKYYAFNMIMSIGLGHFLTAFYLLVFFSIILVFYITGSINFLITSLE